MFGLRLAPNTDVEELASLMPGYVGADFSSRRRLYPRSIGDNDLIVLICLKLNCKIVNRVFGDQVATPAGRDAGVASGHSASSRGPAGPAVHREGRLEGGAQSGPA